MRIYSFAEIMDLIVKKLIIFILIILKKKDPVRGVYLNRAAYLKPGEKEGETILTLCTCIDMRIISSGSFIAVSKGTNGMKNWLNKFKDILEKA